MESCRNKKKEIGRDAYTLEVCADSTESALAAADAGATRLELCANLVIGGGDDSGSGAFQRDPSGVGH